MVRIALTLYFTLAACMTACLSAAIPDVSTLDITSLGDLEGGDPVCDTARRQVIANLRSTSREVQRIGTAAARGGVQNAAVRSAVRRAQTGMREATDGITQVAFTLLGGDEPTQESRELIAKGFGDVREALDAMGSVRPSAALTSRIARARSTLSRAISSSNKLIVDCGGSDPIEIERESSSSPSSTITAPPAPTRTRGGGPRRGGGRGGVGRGGGRGGERTSTSKTIKLTRSRTATEAGPTEAA